MLCLDRHAKALDLVGRTEEAIQELQAQVELYKGNMSDCPQLLMEDLIAMGKKFTRQRELAAMAAAAEAAAAAAEKAASAGAAEVAPAPAAGSAAAEESSSTVAAAEGAAEKAPGDWRAGRRLKSIPVVIVDAVLEDVKGGEEDRVEGTSSADAEVAAAGAAAAVRDAGAEAAPLSAATEAAAAVPPPVSRSSSAKDIIAALPDDLLGGGEELEVGGSAVDGEDATAEPHHHQQKQQQRVEVHSGKHEQEGGPAATEAGEEADISSSEDEDELENLDYVGFRRQMQAAAGVPADEALEALAERDPVAAAGLAAGIALEPEACAPDAAATAAAAAAMVGPSSSSSSKQGESKEGSLWQGAAGSGKQQQKQQQVLSAGAAAAGGGVGRRPVSAAPVPLTLQNVKPPLDLQEQAVKLHNEQGKIDIGIYQGIIAGPSAEDGNDILAKIQAINTQRENQWKKKQAAADVAREKGNGLLRSGKPSLALAAYKQAIVEWPYDARPHANSSQVSV